MTEPIESNSPSPETGPTGSTVFNHALHIFKVLNNLPTTVKSGVSVLLSVLIVAWLVSTIGDGWHDAVSTNLWPGSAHIVAAVTVNLVLNVLTVLVWKWVVTRSGAPISTGNALWVWSSSQLARYGFTGAQIAGRAAIGKRYGVSATKGALSSILEMFCIVSVLAGLSIATTGFWSPIDSNLQWFTWISVIPVLLLGLTTFFPNTTLQIVAAVFRRSSQGRRIVERYRFADVTVSLRTTTFITSTYAILTVARFIPLVILTHGVANQNGSTVLPPLLFPLLAAYSVGQFAGWIAFFSPGGLGPREGVMALIAGPLLGIGAATALVSYVRIAELVAEGVLFLFARTFRERSTPETISDI